MRDLMIFGITLILLFMSLRNGFVAYVLWGWAGLASVGSYLYGFMASFEIVQLFAIIAIIHFFLINKDPDRVPFKPNRTSILFVLLALQILLSTTFAYPGHPRNWEFATNMFKTIGFCMLMPLLVTSRLRIHAFVLMIAIATGFHGIVDGLKFIASAGGHMARGIPKFGDNNSFALALIMAIPLNIYAYRYSANRLVRLAFLVVIPLLVLTVVSTQSRGGWASLIVVALWFILTSRKKVAGLIGIALCAFLVFQLAPEHWLARMDTIGSAEGDSSFLQRLGAWRVNSAIAIANPLLGGGIHSSEIGAVWEKFRDAPNLLGFLSNPDMNGLPGKGRAAHSIYFEIMGDLGFLGFFIFVALIINALKTSREITQISKSAGMKLEWARYLSEMLIISVIAYSFGGLLLSVAYFEFSYIIFMLLEVLKIHVKSQNIDHKLPLKYS